MKRLGRHLATQQEKKAISVIKGEFTRVYHPEHHK